MFHRNLLAALFLLLLCQPATAAGELFISTQPLPPYSTQDGTGFFDTLYRELGRRVGVAITVIQQPDRRSLILTNNGTNDGDGPRIPGLEKKFPNLIRVREPLLFVKVVAFTKKGSRITSWADLAHKHVTFPKDWTLPKNKVPASTRITRITTPHNSIGILAEGRVDAALTVLELGQYDIRLHRHDNIDPNPATLDEQDLYLYLNIKHAALVPAIEQALRDMKADGTWDRLYRQAETQLHK